MSKDLSLDVPLHKVDELTEAFRQRNERISTLTAERDGLLEALEGAQNAINASAEAVDAEWRGHDFRASRSENVVRSWMNKVNALLAKHRDLEKKEQ